MKFNIFTHGDFDGVVSGAIMYNFFRECGFVPESIQFVNYSTHPQDRWDEFSFPEIDVNCVTDYLFSKNLMNSVFYIWSDHHQDRTPIAKPVNGIHFYDPDAPSCVQVLRLLAKQNSVLEQLVPWANIVDSASYESPQQAVLMQEPPLKIAVAITQTFNDDAFKTFLLTSLGTKSVLELSQHPKVEDAYKRYAWKQNKALSFLEKNLVVHSERGFTVGICSFVGYRFSSRYGAFLVNPDLDFLIYIRSIPPWDTDSVSLTVSYNPWKKQLPEVALDKVLQSVHSGDCGGHMRVAAAVLPTTATALELARTLAPAVCQAAVEASTPW